MAIEDEITGEMAQKAARVHEALIAAYGERAWVSRLPPVDELIGTILSQNTSDVNSGRAFELLRKHYPSWQDVIEAPVTEVAETIRSAGLSEIKAPRIQNALRAIRETCGSFDLSSLRELPVDEARAWLTSLHGVGPKTASVVLLFSLKMPAMPVDTHVHRVSLRLGLVPPKTSAPKTSEMLEAMLSAEDYYTFHLNMIEHGRQVCKARHPRHDACTLAPLCDYYQREVQALRG